MKRKPASPSRADLAELQRANLLADQADAAVRENSDVRLVHRANGIESTCYFPPGTDLWDVMRRVDEWAKA